jgi:hypothetical protein
MLRLATIFEKTANNPQKYNIYDLQSNAGLIEATS